MMTPLVGLAAATEVDVGVARVATSNYGGNCSPNWGMRAVDAWVGAAGYGAGAQLGNACQDHDWASGSALWSAVYTVTPLGYDYVLVEWQEVDSDWSNECVIGGYSSFTPGPHNNRFFATICPTGGGPGFLVPRLP